MEVGDGLGHICQVGAFKISDHINTHENNIRHKRGKVAHIRGGAPCMRTLV
jgi:hypothetical protein